MANRDYEIGNRDGAAQCEVYKAFMSYMMLNIGMNYVGDDHLQIIPIRIRKTRRE
jgi:hypothetical protein